MPQPLQGLKILDMTQAEAGTSCTEYLGFLGAEVVKVEPPGTGESGRRGLTKEERAMGFDTAWYFIILNAMKRGITLNLKSEKGVAIFKEMTKKADIVASNFVPGTMDRLGVGYKDLIKVKPDIIYAENSCFGYGGPYTYYPGVDGVAKAAGGVISETGYPDGPPMGFGPSLGDTGSGIHMAVAILAAVHYHDMTGKGQMIDMAMADNVINTNRSRIATTLQTGKPVPRPGTGREYACPLNVYKCKGDDPNDYIYMQVSTSDRYETLMKIVGREDLIPGLKDDAQARWARRKEIDGAIEAWTMNHDKMEAFHLLAKLDVTVAPVLDTVQVFKDPHFRERGIVAEVEHPQRGKHMMVMCPVKMSENDYKFRPAPLLGQHNEEVYAEWLGYSKEYVARLKAEKVI
jgi:formyl-CoA transferase